MTQAYPLSWPQGWPRTPIYQRLKSRFHKKQDRQGYNGTSYKTSVDLTIADAVAMVLKEVERLGGRDPMISSNLMLTTYGIPRSGQRLPDDCGVAVYFMFNKKPRVLACDKWDRAQDNMAAIAKHIEALRGQERWGVGSTEQAFAGYTALPAPKDWRGVLGLHTSLATAETAYRQQAKLKHPDAGGTAEEFAQLTSAIEQARRELSNV